MANYSQSMLQQLMTQQQAPQLSPVAAGVSSGIRRLGGLFGADTRTPQEKQAAALQEQVKSIDLSTPEGLMATARLYQGLGDMASASQFAQLAQQAKKEVRQQQITGLEAAGEEATRRAEAAREKQQLREALNTAREREDTDAVRALSSKSMSPSEYLTGQATKEPVDKYKVVGNRIFDTSTGEYVEPETVAELLPLSSLKDAVTPESLVEYAKTGDKTVLKAKEEEEEVSGDIVGQLISTDTVLETVDKALGLTDDYWVAGYDIAKLIPLPTDAKQMESYVNTLKANLAFDRLQKMRDASKTGGALGQVSNIELGLLQSSVATLDPGSKNFKEQLATVRRQYENFRNSLLGQAPNDPRYIKDPDTGKLYYKLGNDYVDLEEASKTNRFILSPDPRTGGEF